MKFLNLVLMLSLLTAVAFADDSSTYVDVDTSLYSARDIGTGSISIEGGFTVSNGTAHYWNASSGYHTCDLATGAVSDIGQPSAYTNGYGDPAGAYDAASDTFYATTFYSGSASYVYAYDYATDSWSDGIETVNIYGAVVNNGSLYISGLREPWTGGYDSSYVSKVDFSGNGHHDALIETGGASAHVAFDNAGNAYYLPYTTSGSTALYFWSAEQIATVVNDLANGDEDTYLTLADGVKLSDVSGGGNGITVDDAGNVFFTTNGSESILGFWNATMGTGDGDNYEVLATLDSSQYYGWFGPMDIEGNFLEGDSLYGSFGWGAPFTEITYIPEPMTVILLAAGSLLLRRRR